MVKTSKHKLKHKNKQNQLHIIEYGNIQLLEIRMGREAETRESAGQKGRKVGFDFV